MQPLQGACRLYPAPPRAWAALLLPLFLAAFGGVLANWKFDEILARAERTYGNLGDARQRIADWGHLLDASRDLDESARLQAVNAFFNRSLLFASDRQVWGQEEYWATPLELLLSGAVGCYAAVFAFYAAKLDIAYDGFEAVARASFDVRGHMMEDAPSSAFGKVSIDVTVVSDAPADRLREVERLALKGCPGISTLREPVPVESVLTVQKPQAERAA